MAFRTREELTKKGYDSGEDTDNLRFNYVEGTDLLNEIVIFQQRKKGDVQRIIRKPDLSSHKELAQLLIYIGKGHYPCDRRTKQELYEYLGYQIEALEERLIKK